MSFGVSVYEHGLYAEKTTKFSCRAHEAKSVGWVEDVVCRRQVQRRRGHRSKRVRTRRVEGVTDEEKKRTWGGTYKLLVL